MTLIKHVEKRYLDDFRERGLVRIGSLKYYRKIEDVRQDESEGSKSIFLHAREQIVLKREYLRDLMPSYGADKLTVGEGIHLRICGSVPNAYLFCVSKELVPGRFGDSHYQIRDPVPFGVLLLRALQGLDHSVTIGFLGAVQYGKTEPTFEWTSDVEAVKEYLKDGLPDVFRKPLRFACEKEYRYVFIGNERIEADYQDCFCDVTDISKICRFP
jgi:hypothetical protein